MSHLKSNNLAREICHSVDLFSCSCSTMFRQIFRPNIVAKI